MKSQSGLFENQCTELTIFKMGEDLFRFTSFNLGETIKLIHMEEYDSDFDFFIFYRGDTWNFRYNSVSNEWYIFTNNKLINGQMVSGVWKAITRQQIINGEFYNG